MCMVVYGHVYGQHGHVRLFLRGQVCRGLLPRSGVEGAPT